MLQELAELIAGSDEEIGITVHVNDQIDRLEENGILGIRVLDLLRLWCLLRFVQYRLNALRQAILHARIFNNHYSPQSCTARP